MLTYSTGPVQIQVQERFVGTEEFKGGICCGGHLAVTYGGASRFFIMLSRPTNFVRHVLPFSHRFKSCVHLGYRMVKHEVMIIWADQAKRSHQILKIIHLHMWLCKWPLPYNVNKVVKKRPDFPFQSPWLVHMEHNNPHIALALLPPWYWTRNAGLMLLYKYMALVQINSSALVCYSLLHNTELSKLTIY